MEIEHCAHTSSYEIAFESDQKDSRQTECSFMNLFQTKAIIMTYVYCLKIGIHFRTTR